MLSPDRPSLEEFTTWRKADTSGDDGGCVEVANGPRGWKAVRDSTDPTGPALIFNAHEWACFLDGARKGEFDR